VRIEQLWRTPETSIMAGRPYWSGQLQISLVSFGIKLFPATDTKSDVAFHQIDRKTHERIHHLNVTGDDKPVAKADIVKGYEYSKGKYVIVEPDEIKKLRLETQKAIRVAQFVDSAELPPYLFEKPYFAVPDQKGSAEAFAVVREAMAQSGKVAVGEVAFSGREHLVAIAPSPNKKDRGMMAYTLRYAEELRPSKTYFSDISEQSIDKKQLALANELIKTQSAPFRLDEYKDDYEAALRELIDAKRTKSPLPEVADKPKAKVVSLMDALKRSVDETKPKAGRSKRSAKKGPVLVKSGKRSHRAA
jgi:DNA end-binding protein Ku